MRINDHPTGTQPGDTQNFTGEVWMDELIGPSEDTNVSMLRVHFAPGARTSWHQHPHGQILHVLDGEGRIRVRGEEVKTLSAGDTAVAPPGEWHWHGAAPDAMMTMIAVQGADTDGAVVYWGQPVADSDAARGQ